jgi:hypothetical protein
VKLVTKGIHGHTRATEQRNCADKGENRPRAHASQPQNTHSRQTNNMPRYASQAEGRFVAGETDWVASRKESRVGEEHEHNKHNKNNKQKQVQARRQQPRAHLPRYPRVCGSNCPRNPCSNGSRRCAGASNRDSTRMRPKSSFCLCSRPVSASGAPALDVKTTTR